MALDSRRFLELTLLISASACARRAAEPVKPAVTLAPSPDLGHIPPPPAPPELPVAPPEPTTATVDPSCNEGGDVRACDLLTPTCEGGEASFCRDDEHVFRSKVMEGFAHCVHKAERGRCPPQRAARSCLRQVIATGCIDPTAEETCKTLMTECKGAGKKVRYDLATCSKIVSSVHAKRGTPAWASSNLELLGPTAENGSCALDYVLPYYPFGH